MWKRWNDQGWWGTRERPITYPEEVSKSAETVACAVGLWEGFEELGQS